MAWETRTLGRDDEPYHAWAFERDAAQGRAHDRFSPVIVKINADGSDRADLLAKLDWIYAQVTADGEKPFLMSAPDLAHLETVRARHATSNGQTPLEDYERIFLIYMRENKLFPVRDLGAEFEANLELVYIGRPAGAEQIAVTEREIKPGAAAKTACLAIIDDSIAYLNGAFAHNGRSLFDHIWFQKNLDEDAGPGEPASGAQLTGDLIDGQRARLASERAVRVYESEIPAVGGVPFRAIDRSATTHQPLAFPVSHGTHVTDAALKSYVENGGNLGNLALFGVTLPVEVTQNSSGSTLGSYLLAALRQVMLWADDVARETAPPPPLVINFSYGFSAGPKDGSDPLNRVIQLMIDSRNKAGRPTHLIVPMGNNFLDRGMAELVIPGGGTREVSWVLPPNDRTSSFLEVTSLSPNGAGDFRLTLTAPGTATGEAIPIDGSLLTPDGPTARVSVDADGLVAMCCEWPKGPAAEYKRRAFVAMAPTRGDAGGLAEPGHWRVQITNTATTATVFRLSVQRDDAPGTYPALGRQSYLFAEDSRQRHPRPDVPSDVLFDEGASLTHLRTASIFASNQSPDVLTVGAGMGNQGNRESAPVEPSPYASAGPRNSAKDGPDASKLADRSRYFRGIYRAGTHTGTGFAVAGSSVAAPQFAGRLAARPQDIDEFRNLPEAQGQGDLGSARFKG